MAKSLGADIEREIKGKIRQILDRLKGEYGIPEWRPSHDPLSVLISTILSQNTSDTNSRSAFRSLRDSFASWEEMADADVGAIAHAIRRGGLGNIKAPRIKQTLQDIKRKRERIELDFLSQLSLKEAQDWLCQLPGVGLKTARCVLLFALGMPALPVDTHVWRVSGRLGLISHGASPDEAHYALGEIVAPEDVYHFHILLIEHGRRICHARRPDCQKCVLRDICVWYKQQAVSGDK